MKTKSIVRAGLLFLGLFSLLAAACASDGSAQLPTTTPTPRIETLSPTATVLANPTITPGFINQGCQANLNSLIAIQNPTGATMGDVFLEPPEDSDRYRIDFMLSTLTTGTIAKGFTVQILAKPFDDNKLAVEQWFDDQGCTLGDMCSLQVQFASLPGVLDEDSHWYPLPTDCVIPPPL